MIELFRKALVTQFNATLSMFNETVVQCPGDKWEGHVGDYAFWHVAYHTLFFTDLYLSKDEESFEPPSFYRENYQFFGQNPLPPHEQLVADIPFDRDTILEYVKICRDKASEVIASETPESLEGPPGFWWYKVPRAEFYLMNIRHIQHHAAHMGLYLRRAAEIGIDFVTTV
jgi:hypothetical protein